MYTKEQLQGMSDSEVDLALSILDAWISPLCKIETIESFYGIIELVGFNFIKVKEYCSNWNDVMPLAVEHDIDLINSYWYTPTATNDAEEIIKRGKALNRYTHVSNDKPQRAIACCLILVLQEKQK